MIFIVSAPSGAGKTTLCERLQAEFPSLHYAVTATTRAPREPVEAALQAQKDVLMNLDVQGAASVRDYVARLPEGDVLKRPVVDIFVVPPSLEVLKNRLQKRGKDSAEVIARRLKQAEEEIAHGRECQYVVVNDDLAEAYDNMRAIILAERHRISNWAEDRYGR